MVNYMRSRHDLVPCMRSAGRNQDGDGDRRLFIAPFPTSGVPRSGVLNIVLMTRPALDGYPGCPSEEALPKASDLGPRAVH